VVVFTKVGGNVLPAAAAAVRHAASVKIRTAPAGHSLLPSAPDTYAPARDSTAHAAPRPCRSGRARQYPSGAAEVPCGIPPVVHCCRSPASAEECPRVHASVPSSRLVQDFGSASAVQPGSAAPHSLCGGQTVRRSCVVSAPQQPPCRERPQGCRRNRK
jgi:hypothetical protein